MKLFFKNMLQLISCMRIRLAYKSYKISWTSFIWIVCHSSFRKMCQVILIPIVLKSFPLLSYSFVLYSYVWYIYGYLYQKSNLEKFFYFFCDIIFSIWHFSLIPHFLSNSFMMICWNMMTLSKCLQTLSTSRTSAF